MPIMAFTTTPTESSTLGGIISGGTPGGTIAGSIRLQEAGCVGRLIFDHIFIFRWTLPFASSLSIDLDYNLQPVLYLKPNYIFALACVELGSLIVRQDFLYIVVRHI